MNPVFYSVSKNHMEIGVLLGQLGKLRAVPLAGVAAVHQLHLRVLAQVGVKPGQSLLHAHPIGGGKTAEVGTGHLAQLLDFLLGHAGIAKAGNIQVQLLAGIQAKLGAQSLLVLKIACKFWPQKIHHHSTGHRAVFRVHAVVHQPLGSPLAPAGLHAAFGIAAHVEPLALLLGVAEHLLPVQVHNFIQPAHIVVYMAVDGLVVVHTAGHQYLGLFIGKIPELLPVQQLPDLHRVAPPFQLQLEQQVAFVFPHSVFV